MWKGANVKIQKQSKRKNVKTVKTQKCKTGTRKNVKPAHAKM